MKVLSKLNELVLANLFNHNSYKICEPSYIASFNLYVKFSLSSLLISLVDVSGFVRFKLIKQNYYQKNYSKVISLVKDNIGFLVQSKKYEYIYFAAYSTSNNQLRMTFMLLAVIANPTCLNSVSFSALYSSLDSKEEFLSYLKCFVDGNDKLNDFEKFIISSFLNNNTPFYRLKNIQSKLSDNQQVIYLSIKNDYNSIASLFEEDKLNVSELSAQCIDMLFHSLVKANKLNAASTLLNSKLKNKISNKQINDYWFSQGNLINGFESMRDRDMSNVFKLVFGKKYIQSLDSIIKDETLLVLASWGPGDDIRYSTLFNAIKECHSSVTFTCEPRLFDLFSNIYPDLNFIPCERTKRIMVENSDKFTSFPHHKIHHVMDRHCISKVKNFNKVTLLTDLIPDILSKKESVQLTKNNIRQIKSIVNSEKIDHFIDSVKENSCKTLVGLCWRSMIQRQSRNAHYFSLESMQSLFELENCLFVSLQYDNCDNEISYIKEKFNIDVYIPPIDQLNDFESVVYLMQSLDVIISAGTAVLELAGVSGTTTYALVNSESQNYRINNNIDFWFDNILYIPDATKMNKLELVESIKQRIS